MLALLKNMWNMYSQARLRSTVLDNVKPNAVQSGMRVQLPRASAEYESDEARAPRRGGKRTDRSVVTVTVVGEDGDPKTSGDAGEDDGGFQTPRDQRRRDQRPAARKPVYGSSDTGRRSR